ncbi:unnamed protein product, partial [Arabidopsis halleri]
RNVRLTCSSLCLSSYVDCLHSPRSLDFVFLALKFFRLNLLINLFFFSHYYPN